MARRISKANYHDTDMNYRYMSVSQYKDFMKCEAMAMAKLKGKYRQELTRALLVGSFVDAYFEKSLKRFMREHPEIYTQKDTLRAEYRKAKEIIKRIKRDKLFMQFMSGTKQKVLTTELFGIEWKIKIDSYLKGTCITDLKVVKDYYSLTMYGYDLQGAVYQKVTELKTGEKLPFYLAVATKEKVTNLDVFQISQPTLDYALETIEDNINHIVAVKNGSVEPIECGKCNYCKSVKSAGIRRFEELLVGA